MDKFLIWWHSEGSGINPNHFDDIESFARKVCEIDWSNGEYTGFVVREQLLKENENLKQAIMLTLEENGHLTDGEVCTLWRLKKVLNNQI